VPPVYKTTIIKSLNVKRDWKKQNPLTTKKVSEWSAKLFSAKTKAMLITAK
jgi:hypothetical protein